MEEFKASMNIKEIHGIPVTGPARSTGFGRAFAVTTDGRQWTRHFRDRNKANGGWIEVCSDQVRSAESSAPTLSSNSTSASFSTSNDAHGVAARVRAPIESKAVLNPTHVSPSCELCVLTHEYGNEAVDGELQLHLATMWQTQGELKHWGLFVGRETGKGEMLQVKGDWLHMQYAPETTENVFGDPNFVYPHFYTMARNLTPRQVLVIKETASSVRPPRAENVREIRGNCQTWCIEVLYELVKLGIATKDHVVKADLVYRQLLPSEGEGDSRIKAMVGGGWTWISKGGWTEVEENIGKA